jgi:hypothetical protein
MLTAMFASLLWGLIVGRYFKVGVVAAASAVLFLLIFFVGVVQASPWWMIALSSLLDLAAFQAGYLAPFAAEAFVSGDEQRNGLHASSLDLATADERAVAAEAADGARSLG